MTPSEREQIKNSMATLWPRQQDREKQRRDYFDSYYGDYYGPARRAIATLSGVVKGRATYRRLRYTRFQDLQIACPFCRDNLVMSVLGARCTACGATVEKIADAPKAAQLENRPATARRTG